METFGKTQICIGTDYPFAMGDFTPVAEHRPPRRIHPRGNYCNEREALSRAGVTSFERTSLIEPRSTASATSS
jgi:hypothetical protein